MAIGRTSASSYSTPAAASPSRTVACVSAALSATSVKPPACDVASSAPTSIASSSGSPTAAAAAAASLTSTTNFSSKRYCSVPDSLMVPPCLLINLRRSLASRPTRCFGSIVVSISSAAPPPAAVASMVYTASASVPPGSSARSIFSFGTRSFFASATAAASRGLASRSGPPSLAAMAMSRDSRAKSLPRLASARFLAAWCVVRPCTAAERISDRAGWAQKCGPVRVAPAAAWDMTQKNATLPPGPRGILRVWRCSTLGHTSRAAAATARGSAIAYAERVLYVRSARRGLPTLRVLQARGCGD
mmetsp:Transcript_27466/g.72179  ORF Transcript_27466/g.72179 Transcript_27466/m.72179 type:complete len:303 (-) Transcript_27466:135-1043(-)